MSEALEKAQTTALVMPPQSTLALAIEKGMDTETISKLMDLQERWEANQARKAYTEAMAGFKRECPAVIGKDRKADFGAGKAKYSYATTGAIVQAITPALSKYGLSLSWETEQSEKHVRVTCRVMHEGGHSESAVLNGPHDESGGKNAIQQLGSAVHYLQRYTMVSVLGLATADMDDPDQQPTAREPIREPQARQQQEHQPDSSAQGTTVTGIIANVSVKPTTRGGKRYGIQIGAFWFNTFDDKIGEMAESLKGASVHVAYTVNDKGYNDITDMMPSAEQPTK